MKKHKEKKQKKVTVAPTPVKDGFNVETTEGKILEVLREVSDVLSKTLGPYGTTTIIEQRNTNHKMTKDGYTVLTHMFYRNSLKRTILEFIKRVSANLVNTVGDGSTSSVITAASLMEELHKFVSSNFLPPAEVVNALELVSAELQEAIKAQSVKIDLSTDQGKKDLYNINFISTNGDVKISQMITDIYSQIGHMGSIQLENGKDRDTTYEIKKGIDLARGMLDPAFSTERTDTSFRAVYDDARVIMLDCAVGMEHLALMYSEIEALNGLGIPVVIIASDYDRGFVEAMIKFRQEYREEAKILLVDMATASTDAIARFEDLATYIGCTPYYGSSRSERLEDDTFHPDKFGRVSKVISSDNKTSFLVDENEVNSKRLEDRKKELLERVAKLTNINNEFDYSKEIKNLMLRLSSLEGGSAIIRVGGDSNAAIETKKFLYEDAIFASRSALFEGYILGGNTAVFKLLATDNDLYNRIVDKIVSNTILSKQTAEELVCQVRACFTNVYSKVIEVANLPYISAQIIEKNPDFALKMDTEWSMVENIVYECLVNKDVIFNIRTLKFEKFGETNIINSAATDIEIVKSCFSIVSLLATSNQLVKTPEFMSSDE